MRVQCLVSRVLNHHGNNIIFYYYITCLIQLYLLFLLVQLSTYKFTLYNILCAPKIFMRLLSIPKFTRDNFVYFLFEFYPTYFIVKDVKAHRELLGNPLRDRLYYLKTGPRCSILPHALVSSHMSNSL